MVDVDPLAQDRRRTRADRIRSRGARDEVITMVLATVSVLGLYVDGYHHIRDETDTFFSPWHALLYSGYCATFCWAMWVRARDRRERVPPRDSGAPDRLMLIGSAMIFGGVFADLAWHTAFGFEHGIEPSVSPPHLLLMTGGLLGITGPIRSSWRWHKGPTVAALMSLTLAVCLMSFFIGFLSPFSFADFHISTSGSYDVVVVRGVSSVYVTTTVLVGMIMIARRRWEIPHWGLPLMLSTIGIAHTGVTGFQIRLPVLALPIAALTAEVLMRRGANDLVLGTVFAGTLWMSYFAFYAVERGVAWHTTLWSGSVVWAIIIAAAVSHFTETTDKGYGHPPTDVRSRDVSWPA